MRHPLAQLPVILIVVLAATVCAAGPAGQDPVSLAGPFRVAVCDNLQCDYPPPDSPKWDLVRLGPSGLDQPLPHQTGVGWVRLDFDLPLPGEFREPALLISNPADAERVFLNDVPLGGEGIIGSSFATVPGPVRVLRIPPGALHAGKNTLKMNVLFAEKNVALLNGPFRIGEYDRLGLEAERMRAPVIGMEAAFLTLFGLILAFYAFLIIKGVARSDYVLFVAFTATYALTFLLGSNLLHELGLSGPLTERIASVSSPATSLLMLALVTSVAGAPFGTVFGLFAAASAGFILLNIAMPTLPALYALAGPRKIYLGLAGIYYLAVSIMSVARRREDAVVILVGVASYVVGSRIELFWGLRMQDYSMGVFALCMLFALVSRYSRLQARLVVLSTKLLDAHEQERSRIARDIHDSLGQSLLALKLRLQMLASKAAGGNPLPPETLDGLAQDASRIIDEVRRTSMDLRPSFIESMSFMEAVNWYAEAFMERSGIDLQVHDGEEEISVLPPRVKDNMYRALQEILSNARKHANATRIDISVYRSGGCLFLKVSDNGVGIAPPQPGNKGIGLETMRERAELLGGRCTVAGSPGSGTTVTLEVPLK